MVLCPELKKPLNEAPALTPITSMERSEERDPESGQRALDESRPSSSVGITTSAFNPTPSPGEGIAGGKLARMAVGESEMNIAHASLNSKICLHSLFIQNRKKK